MAEDRPVSGEEPRQGPIEVRFEDGRIVIVTDEERRADEEIVEQEREAEVGGEDVNNNDEAVELADEGFSRREFLRHVVPAAVWLVVLGGSYGIGRLLGSDREQRLALISDLTGNRGGKGLEDEEVLENPDKWQEGQSIYAALGSRGDVRSAHIFPPGSTSLVEEELILGDGLSKMITYIDGVDVNGVEVYERVEGYDLNDHLIFEKLILWDPVTRDQLQKTVIEAESGVRVSLRYWPGQAVVEIVDMPLGPDNTVTVQGGVVETIFLPDTGVTYVIDKSFERIYLHFPAQEIRVLGEAGS